MKIFFADIYWTGCDTAVSRQDYVLIRENPARMVFSAGNQSMKKE